MVQVDAMVTGGKKWSEKSVKPRLKIVTLSKKSKKN